MPEIVGLCLFLLLSWLSSMCVPPAQSHHLPTLGQVGVVPGQALPCLLVVVSGLFACLLGLC